MSRNETIFSVFGDAADTWKETFEDAKDAWTPSVWVEVPKDSPAAAQYGED